MHESDKYRFTISPNIIIPSFPCNCCIVHVVNPAISRTQLRTTKAAYPFVLFKMSRLAKCWSFLGIIQCELVWELVASRCSVRRREGGKEI